jgi:PKD repeat protein
LLWDFGDGSTQVGSPVVSHTYSTYGLYTATLTVTGTYSTDHIQQPIYILQPWSLLSPILSGQQPALMHPVP